MSENGAGSATSASSASHPEHLEEITTELPQFKLNDAKSESRTYPVLTLPAEITAEIFCAYLPPYPSCPQIDRPESPIHLTRVCRQWRNIAHSTPTLWRAVYVNDPSRDAHKLAVGVLAAFLERSGTFPLSIHLGCNPMTSDPALVVQAILPYRQRWQYLKLDVDDEVLACIAGPMPLLAGLALEGVMGSPAPVFALTDAPNLRALSLWAVDCAQPSSAPWRQLTAVSLTGYSPSQCAAMLQHATNIIFCAIRLDLDADSPTPAPIHIRLPRLETLVLDCYISEDAFNMPGCLDMWTLPSLQHLQVDEYLLNLKANAVEQLTSLVSRSRCPLQELRILGQFGKFFDDEVYRSALPDGAKISRIQDNHDGEWVKNVMPFTVN
ncbi:hypothetical protein C8F01DRAFT_1098478 [Mycena amicta]|nr:hypothetical protein C8F01DRAFT_1098478 [Mycena amicta]